MLFRSLRGIILSAVQPDAMSHRSDLRGLVNLETQGRRLWHSLLGALYPPRCGGCGTIGSLWCETCQSGLLPVCAPMCAKCGEPNVPHRLCAKCREHPLQIDFVRSVVIFQGALRQAVHRFKYQRLASLADLFGDWLGDYWIENQLHADRIMPVPLHPARERERGYNQSGLLAKRLSKRVGVPVAESGLQRIRATAVQMELDAAQRRLNVAGAFVCVDPAVRQKRVVVIDDVCTTGATLEACAAALLQARAASVFGLTLARTP